MGGDGAADGGTAGVGCTQEDFTALIVVVFDEGVGTAVELLLGTIDKVDDGVVGEGDFTIEQGLFAAGGEGVVACESDGMTMNDGVVEGVAHHHLSF